MLKNEIHILIVDDMSTVRKLLKKSLVFNGYTDVEEAASGSSAWEKIENATSPFGLIISDREMPYSSGLDLLKRVRSREALKKIPFIMLSTGTEKSDVVEALQLGVSGFLVKPFTNESVFQCMSAVYKKYFG